MPADLLRLFVFARHAESVANAANMLNSSPSQPVALSARGRTQARALGAQLANLHVDLAVGTRLLRTRQTITRPTYPHLRIRSIWLGWSACQPGRAGPRPAPGII
jgi:bisphosphoglycerate-dependent phosphoglycerate mutase